VPIGFARTPDGRRLEVSRRIEASRERVWRLLRAVDRWPDWGSTVRAVDCPPDQLEAGRYVRAGTRGRVRLPAGAWVPFRVVACADYRWSWRVGRPSWRATAALGGVSVPATAHRVEAADGVDPGVACRAVFEVPPLAAGYGLVCRRALGTLAGLAEAPP
jgi:hypothetical protein